MSNEARMFQQGGLDMSDEMLETITLAAKQLSNDLIQKGELIEAGKVMGMLEMCKRTKCNYSKIDNIETMRQEMNKIARKTELKAIE